MSFNMTARAAVLAAVIGFSGGGSGAAAGVVAGGRATVDAAVLPGGAEGS